MAAPDATGSRNCCGMSSHLRRTRSIFFSISFLVLPSTSLSAASTALPNSLQAESKQYAA